MTKTAGNPNGIFCRLAAAVNFVPKFGESSAVLSYFFKNSAGILAGAVIMFQDPDYSTVTDFARFLGLSTSQPRSIAM